MGPMLLSAKSAGTVLASSQLLARTSRISKQWWYTNKNTNVTYLPTYLPQSDDEMVHLDRPRPAHTSQRHADTVLCSCSTTTGKVAPSGREATTSRINNAVWIWVPCTLEFFADIILIFAVVPATLLWFLDLYVMKRFSSCCFLLD